MKHDVSDKVRDLVEKRRGDDTAASSIRDRSGKVRRQALMLSYLSRSLETRVDCNSCRQVSSITASILASVRSVRDGSRGCCVEVRHRWFEVSRVSVAILWQSRKVFFSGCRFDFRLVP